MGNKKCTVYIEAWQIQCCGYHFKIGESIKWRLEHYGKVMEFYEDAGIIDYYYENHPLNTSGYYVLLGTVASIDILYTKLIPDRSRGTNCVMRSDSYSKPVKEAFIWEKNERKFSFDGYIVHFDDYQIRPEEKAEQYPSKNRLMNLKKTKECFGELYPDEVIPKLIKDSGNVLTKDLIYNKFAVDALRNHVGGDPFIYFDDDSYEKLDLKIEVLTALKKGMSPKDIQQYYDIFELLPPDYEALKLSSVKVTRR